LRTVNASKCIVSTDPVRVKLYFAMAAATQTHKQQRKKNIEHKTYTGKNRLKNFI